MFAQFDAMTCRSVVDARAEYEKGATWALVAHQGLMDKGEVLVEGEYEEVYGAWKEIAPSTPLLTIAIVK